MTFMESVKLCLGPEYFFKFQGRAPRSEFWWFMVFIGIVNFCTSAVVYIFPPMLAASISLIISLMLFPANLGVTVRRLHDRNLRGWWLLLPIGALFLWMAGANDGSANQVGSMLSLAMCVGYLAILAMPGQPAANRFGPPPIEYIKD